AGLARSVLACCVAPAAVDGDTWRQPAAGDPVLVLAPRVSLLSPRRERLPCKGRAAPGARDLRKRTLCFGSSVRPGCGAAGAGRTVADDGARASARRPLPPADRRRPRRDGPGARRAEAGTRRAEARGERLSQGDGTPQVVVRNRRRGGGSLPGRCPARA